MKEINFHVEKVEIKPGLRRLKGNWTIEIGPTVHMYAIPETRWSKFCHWLKWLGRKGKVEKL